MCVCVTGLSGALCCLPSLSHSLAEVLSQGVATSHTTSAEDGQSTCHLVTIDYMMSCVVPPSFSELVAGSKTVGESALKFLEVLKTQGAGSGVIASGANDVQTSIRGLERMTQVRSSWAV